MLIALSNDNASSLEDSFLSSIDPIPGGGVTVGGLDNSWTLVGRAYPRLRQASHLRVKAVAYC